jgi:hypothetical protein
MPVVKPNDPMRRRSDRLEGGAPRGRHVCAAASTRRSTISEADRAPRPHRQRRSRPTFGRIEIVDDIVAPVDEEWKAISDPHRDAYEHQRPLASS